MKIKLIAVGRLKDAYLRAMVDDYKTRIGRFAKLEIVEISDQPNRPGEEEKAKGIEFERAGRYIKSTDYLVALDARGREMSSRELAPFLEEAAVKGKGEIAFLIGGSLGLHEKAFERADFVWSFSHLTLTHGFARALLLEQVYRAFKIKAGEPYDK